MFVENNGQLTGDDGTNASKSKNRARKNRYDFRNPAIFLYTKSPLSDFFNISSPRRLPLRRYFEGSICARALDEFGFRPGFDVRRLWMQPQFNGTPPSAGLD